MLPDNFHSLRYFAELALVGEVCRDKRKYGDDICFALQRVCYAVQPDSKQNKHLYACKWHRMQFLKLTNHRLRPHKHCSSV